MHHAPIRAIVAGTIAALLLSACGDVEPVQPETVDGDEREQEVTIIPEFEIDGTSTLPDKLALDELGMTVSEIQLEPIDDQEHGVAYSTRRPTPLSFDLSDNETSKRGEAIALPEAGKYLVNVRLEPVTEVKETAEGASETVHSSFSVAGRVDSPGSPLVNPSVGDSTTSGKPIPVPYDEDDTQDVDQNVDDDGDEVARETAHGEWTSFHYQSDRSVYMTLDEVDLEEGEQVLAFKFDVSQWALELLDPLLDALEGGDGVHYDDGGLDVSTPMESHGQGAESLLDNAQVDSM